MIIEGEGDGFAVEATPLAGPEQVTIQPALYREWYICAEQREPIRGCQRPLAPGRYPEALIPLSAERHGNGFSIPSRDFHDVDGARFPNQRNQAIWVDIHIPADALAGRYAGRIEARTGDGTSHSVGVQFTDEFKRAVLTRIETVSVFAVHDGVLLVHVSILIAHPIQGCHLGVQNAAPALVWLKLRHLSTGCYGAGRGCSAGG